MKTRWIIGMAGALALGGCGQEPVPDLPPRRVHTVEVEEPSGTVERSFSGLVAAAEGTSLAFETSGRVVEVAAEEGERYPAGATLAELDETEYRNQLNAAEAQWTEAKQTLRRVQQLFETGNASQGDLETAIAKEQAARSQFQTAEKKLRDTVLRMPYAGVIGSVEVNAGEVVNAGQPVMSIQGEGRMEFETGVPAEVVAQVEPGQEASIRVGPLAGETFPARVKTVSPVPASTTIYPVVLAFLEGDARIREGMDGEAVLTLPRPEGEVLRVPSACVAALPGDRRYVWVVNPGEGNRARVTRRWVMTGRLAEDDTVEIREGLKPGETVVSRGVHHLEEGQTVRLP